jgi:hypothetical protein
MFPVFGFQKQRYNQKRMFSQMISYVRGTVRIIINSFTGCSSLSRANPTANFDCNYGAFAHFLPTGLMPLKLVKRTAK